MTGRDETVLRHAGRSCLPLRTGVSRASWITRRIRLIHGEPCSSGREAMVSAKQQNPPCRLAPALELRRPTRRAAEDSSFRRAAKPAALTHPLG